MAGPARPVTILVADDHPVVRIGVCSILAAHPSMTVVAEAPDGAEAVRLVETLRPDVLLLDLAMPGLPGFDALREIMSESPGVRVILLTGAIEERQILEALQLGARGVVLKDAVVDDLTGAVAAVMDGHYWLRGAVVTNLVPVLRDLMARTAPASGATFGLSRRELEVVAKVVEGCTNKEIAAALGISEETVKRHLTNSFDKTGVSSRLELAMFALHHRLAPRED